VRRQRSNQPWLGWVHDTRSLAGDTGSAVPVRPAIAPVRPPVAAAVAPVLTGMGWQWWLGKGWEGEC
jgi:hypothetical protein